MRVVTFYRLKEDLEDGRKQKAFFDLLALRQRTFSLEYSKILCLDQYDLIAHHVLLYTDEGRPLGYMRAINRSECLSYGQPFPFDALKTPAAESEEVKKYFEKDSLMQCELLCVDRGYTNPLQKDLIFAKNFMGWLMADYLSKHYRDLSFVLSANKKYRFLSFVEEAGSYHYLGEIIHPKNPVPHENFLISNLHPNFLKISELKFKKFVSEVIDLNQSTEIIEKIAA